MNKTINDFSITVGTVNGSGSSTANNTILRSIFKMGIPVSGKNLFPSNIQGLPTWYTIRANKDGFIAHHEQRDIVIAMNPNSFARDLASVVPGGAFFYADDIKQPITRADIAIYPMPVKTIVRNDPNVPSDFRDLVGNMVYVGILAQMIGMDINMILAALTFHFKGKQKPIDMNFNAVKAGAEWAKANLEKKDPFYVEPMNKTAGLIMADGNTAAALGSIFGGVQFAGWYPITPATSLAESLNDYLPQLRKPYAWFVRVHDLPAFIHHIAPALETRLEKSIAIGYGGEIKFNFYRNGMRLVFERGKLITAEAWRPTPDDWGHVGFPDLTFLQILFGYRSYQELRLSFADCYWQTETHRALLDILFPKKLSNVLGIV